jgi:predicted alpha/beta hydrolase family esterase
MKRVIIIHGWSGGSRKDWLPWLRSELHNKGYDVSVPDMPDAEMPVIEKWVTQLAEIVGVAGPDENTFFVGHSMGCQTILRYLETLPVTTRVGGAIFVAGWFFLENLEDDEVRVTAKPWLERPIDITKIKNMLSGSALLISDNDPYDAFEKNKEKFAEVGSKIVELHSAGHLTAEDGFSELPLVLKELEAMTMARI